MKSVIKKAVKKFKLWSKKRTRKKKKHEHDAYYPPSPPPGPPPPPPPYHYHCHTHRCSSSSSSAQPSAPPLPVAATAPSWLETEHNYNYGTFLASPEEANYHATNASQPHAQAPEIAMPMDPRSPAYPIPPYGYDHQYSVLSVSEPAVYGIPVPLIQTTRRARSSVHFGSVLSFGVYLFRCLCPCFHSHTVEK